MKKLLAMTLAVALAVTTVAATTTTADAKHRDWGWPFAAGALLGFGLGYSVHPRRYQYVYPRRHHVHPRAYYRVEPHAYYPTQAYRLGSAHVDWCSWRYRTYNPATNTYFIRRGVPAVCVSPYSPY